MSSDPSPRVVVLGKGRLAVDCLKYLWESGARVVGVVPDPNDDGSDGWQPSLRKAASAVGLEVGGLRAGSRALDRDWISQRAPEYLLSFQFAQILNEATLRIPSVASLNLHFAPLPRYRGVAPIYWAIRNGEREHGVTLHHIDPGIDTGDIISIRRFAIARDATARDLYDRSASEAAGLFEETWPAILRGEAPRVSQVAADSLYYNRHSTNFSILSLDWTLDAEELSDMARSLAFPPLQLPVVRAPGGPLEVVRCDFDREGHAARPGQVLGVEDCGLVVAASGGRLHLKISPADLGHLAVSVGDLLTD